MLLSALALGYSWVLRRMLDTALLQAALPHAFFHARRLHRMVYAISSSQRLLRLLRRAWRQEAALPSSCNPDGYFSVRVPVRSFSSVSFLDSLAGQLSTLVRAVERKLRVSISLDLPAYRLPTRWTARVGAD